ncbi:hypothetical protein CAP35_13125 [Chitinophagaceae bacterium IBVUCB1]|nr:hypothetical protein CAP35_13125 [Chitinophagaceae bacterium IBVUCB1]
MINFENSVLTNCIVHIVGNKTNDEKLLLSDIEVVIESNEQILMDLFIKPFKILTGTFNFYHDIKIAMNDVFTLADNIFENEDFIQNTQLIAKHLYNNAKHHAIKQGDLLIGLLDDIEYDGLITKGLIIIKSEKKESYIKIHSSKNKNVIEVDSGISKNKIDKACLIINDAYHEGFKVYTFEQSNIDTDYWNGDFLKIKQSTDKYRLTSALINICKEYSNSYVKSNFGKQEQVSFINNSINYIKEKDELNIQKFEKEFFIDDNERREFKKIKSAYINEHNIEFPPTITVSKDVVTQLKKKIKNEIKLDTNILIKLEGSDIILTQQYIEHGYDNRRKMNYYKVFYNDEK